MCLFPVTIARVLELTDPSPLLSALLTAFPGMVSVVDVTGACRYFGGRDEELARSLLGRATPYQPGADSIYEGMPTESAELIRAGIVQAQAQGETTTTHWVGGQAYRTTFARLPEGATLICAVDVTGQRDERVLEELVGRLGDVYLLTLADDGSVRWAAGGGWRTISVDPDDLCGQSIDAVIDRLALRPAPPLRAAVEAALRGESVRGEGQIAERRIDWEAAPFNPVADAAPAVLWAATDRTEARDVERHLDAILRHLPGIIVSLVGPDLRYIYAGGAVLTDRNLAGRRLAGRPVGTLSKRLHTDPATAVEGYRAALAGRRAHRDAHIRGRIFEEEFVPLVEEGAVLGALAMARDVTETRTAERRLSAVLDHLPGIGVSLIDAELVHRVTGGQAFAACGIDPTALIGRTVGEMALAGGAESPGEAEARIRSVLEGGGPLQEEFVFAGRIFLVHHLPMRDANGAPAVLSVTRDVTEEREHTRALEAERERLAVAIAHVAGSIFTQDRSLRYTWSINPIPPMDDAALIIGRTDREI